MAQYEIRPERSTLHGILSKSISPCLSIEPGDSVVFQCLEADWRLEKPERGRTGEGRFFSRQPEYDVGHALCGPVSVKDAKPGMTLVVHIEEIIPGNWGWSRVGLGEEDHLRGINWHGSENFKLWDIDTQAGFCRSDEYEVPLEPFLGVLTVCPDSTYPVKTHLPGNHGGNLDCKSIVAGSTLYLPIYVDGALFSTGDGHALQGDGESGGTAIECPVENARLRFELLDEFCGAPVCNTPSGWITFGFHENLNQAAYDALYRMVRLIERLYGISREDAWNLSSLVTDLHITQIVNGIRGCHVILPHGKLHVNR